MLLLPYFIQAEVHEFCSCGFPHSDICGSKDACSSPQLFAACHVLHRLEVPRHPPCALSSLTIKFTHEQQTDLKSNVRSEINSLSEKLQVSYSYCACTVKLALCVSLLSDITPLRSEISNLRSQRVTSDNSQYSIIKDLFTTFDRASKLQHSKVDLRCTACYIWLAEFENSSSAAGWTKWH